MSAEFVPNSAIDRVEGFLKFASDRLAPHQVEDLRVVVQAARAATALYEALVGPDDDGTAMVGRLGWLSALINDMKIVADTRGDYVRFDLGDPDATWEAIGEIEALIRDARAALKQARGDLVDPLEQVRS